LKKLVVENLNIWFWIKMSEAYRRQQKQSFILDRYGAGPMAMIPHYQAINEVPLPCVRNKQGMIIALMRCFNCGSNSHNLRDCKVKRDRDCIQMNKTWMHEYARIGVKKSRDHHEVHARYFINNQPDSKGDTTLNEYKNPADSNVDDKDKPPDLRIITEETED